MNFKRNKTIQLNTFLSIFPCVAILGPRQVGKTTLAKEYMASHNAIYIDLESDEDLQKINNAEQYFNNRAERLIIIDEIQRKPELLVLLRSVIDKKRINGRFILLGSASPELLMQSSESLAGRIGYLELHPLLISEVTQQEYNFDRLWLKGGFPNIFLQDNNELSYEMQWQFIQTYLERELPLLGLSASSTLLKNLMKMVAHNQSHLLSYTELSKSIGVEINTVKRYLDYFENAFLIRRLSAFHTNSKKRIVKSSKIFIRDTGIYHALFNIQDQEDLDGFNAKGSSWESFVIQQIIAACKSSVTPYFYRTQDGTELDLVLTKGNEVICGLEVKYSNAPKITKGTTIASQDLGNIPVFVITHSVMEDYQHNNLVTITSFIRVFNHLHTLGLLVANGV